MSTKIILIRHTATGFNLKAKYCGSTDIDISPLGKRQLIKLSRYWKKKRYKIDKAYSSDLKRAITCAKRLFGNNFEIMKDFREVNFGAWEGLTHNEIMNKFPDSYRKWLTQPSSTIIPGGERYNDFKKRVAKVLQRVLNKYRNKTIAIVTHGGTIKLIFSDLLGKKENFWKIPQDAGAINILEYRNDKLIPILINDISYK